MFEIVLADLLGLDSSISRARALIATGGAATKLLLGAELEERLSAIEAAIGRREHAADEIEP